MMLVLSFLLALSFEESLRCYYPVNRAEMGSNFILEKTEEAGLIGANLILENTL